MIKTPIPTTPVSHGFVPWPEAIAETYRGRWWSGTPLGALPHLWAERDPHKTALIDADQALTYGELRDRVDALACSLAALGLQGPGTGDRVLVHLPNSIEIVVTVLACARFGAVPVLSLPSHGESELLELAQRSEARAVVIADRNDPSEAIDMASRLLTTVPTLHHAIVARHRADAVRLPAGLHSFDELSLATGAETAPLPHPDSTAVAVLLLSGGTTGSPKLIPRTHDDYVYNFRASAAACDWSESTVFLASIPIAHNFGLACPGVLGVLEVGGTAVLTASPSPGKVFEAINRHGVTVASAVPAVVQRWIEHRLASGQDLPTLGAVIVGGARLAEELARRVEPVLGAKLQQALGMAEGLVNFTRLDDPPRIAWETQGRPISPADEVRVVDPTGMDVPDGSTGELWTRGPYTIRGYWRADEHNQKAFHRDGWYRTGDLVSIGEGGNLVVEGRIKDVINRAGEKISAEEIENILYALPDVREAAVVAKPDPRLGEQVAAIIALTDDASDITLERITQHFTRSKVAGFKTPEVLLILPELPHTKVGKIDKASLRTLLLGRRGHYSEAGEPTTEK